MKQTHFIKNLKEVKKEKHYIDKPAELYRTRKRLGKAVGAQNIGINYCYLKPGQLSSKYHCHTKEEEFFFIIRGNALLRYGDEEYNLKSGDSVSILPGGPLHQLRNDSNEECIYLAIGIRDPEDFVIYSCEGIVRKNNIEPIK